MSSDTTAHLSDDNITTVTAEGKDSPELCSYSREDIRISSAPSQTNIMEVAQSLVLIHKEGDEELAESNTNNIRATEELLKTTSNSPTNIDEITEIVVLDDGNQKDGNLISELVLAMPASRCDTQGQESDVCASIKM